MQRTASVREFCQEDCGNVNSLVNGIEHLSCSLNPPPSLDCAPIIHLPVAADPVAHPNVLVRGDDVVVKDRGNQSAVLSENYLKLAINFAPLGRIEFRASR